MVNLEKLGLNLKETIKDIVNYRSDLVGARP